MVSLVLAVATIPLLVWFAGKVYRNAVLRTGARVPLREALRG
jgi:ABC-2 type transport system permease protein